ncbi:LOW QUALITY PROTEIN: glucose dehydrogenase [FAD, quinone]-like [Uloborus diversus]|uniref:LOW QUALITY PROTEIN: glucose dehydrogenase [FAD, quinone]-like n=1 Tax=Uloborus diversus TaxID=327109 RepID=UPI00240941F6|nr:LOW QUALITY PROTEIN: glucose dehydrogenase [FAD, quinone]-like [Uloborus diversus]
MRRIRKPFENEYDYIIIGAGSAGSVLASRLSEMPCAKILLLEAGKSPPILSDVPSAARSFIRSDIDWNYLTVPQRHTAAGHKNRQVPWPSGKTLGGSSTLNAMLYVRGNRKNYDEWAKQGAIGWSYDDVLPYFKKLENYTEPKHVNNGFHGTSGPVTASTPKFNPPVKLAAMEAATNLGYEFVDSNGPRQTGFYNYQSNTRRGQRCGTAKAYLVPSENRTNLDILTNAMVKKVVIENKRATKVIFDFEGSSHEVRAKREIILSAGTTNTAQLLMLSGIGPMAELSKFGIPVIADLPVGHNLQDHCATFLAYELSDRQKGFEKEIKLDENIRKYIEKREGPLTTSEGFMLMSFLSKNMSKMQNDIPDFSLYLVDFVREVPLKQFGISMDVMLKYFGFYAFKTTIVCASQILHPRSRGTVTLNSTNPYDPPLIDPNYYADYQDIDDVVQGLKVCKKLMGNSAMEKVGARLFASLLPGCEKFADDEELYLRCVVRTLVITTNHQVGTAKMGDPNDPTTVVDPRLKVKTIRGLRVVDASVMPTIPWGNTNIPTIMIAEKASDIIKSTIRCH